MSETVDDVASDDCVSSREEPTPKKPKTDIKRLRMSCQQIGLAVKHCYSTVPKMKLVELAEWCKDSFKLDLAPKV